MEKPIYKSKKFWMSILGVASVVMGKYLGLDEAQVMKIGALVLGYVFSQGLADFGKSSTELAIKSGS